MNRHKMLAAAILDVDGVLLASPHERAWREALQGITDPARFTTAMYQAAVAGKPRRSGAVAALEALGVPNATKLAPAYAASKQKRLEELIGAGASKPFPMRCALFRRFGRWGGPWPSPRRRKTPTR